MARASGHVRSAAASSTRAARTGPVSANEPTQRRAAPTRAASGARARKAALRELLAAAGDISERAAQTRSEPWAIAYLETVRGFKPPPPPMSPADQVKLAEIQADQMAGVIRAVLERLNLSDADHTRGIDLAIKELRAASSQGWEPP
jgi:hypothetical protein